MTGTNPKGMVRRDVCGAHDEPEVGGPPVHDPVKRHVRREGLLEPGTVVSTIR